MGPNELNYLQILKDLRYFSKRFFYKPYNDNTETERKKVHRIIFILGDLVVKGELKLMIEHCFDDEDLEAIEAIKDMHLDWLKHDSMQAWK